VFCQSFTDYEVIVVNDGTPDTAELEQELAPYLDRITYIKQENKGPGGARNTGIRCASGEFVALLDSDDQWLPDHLAEMIEIIRKDPSVDLIYADAVNFGELESAGRTSMETNPSDGIADFESLMERRCNVIASCVVARRTALIEAGLFDENFVYAEDYDLWLRVAYAGKRIEYLTNVHSRRRIHEENLTSNIIKSYQGQADVLRKLMRELALSDHIRNKMQLEIERCEAFIALEKAKQKIVAGQYDRAAQELKRANGFFHQRKLTLALLFLRTVPNLVRHVFVKHWSKSVIAAMLQFTFWLEYTGFK
jgi:glycosyltransferase involved in cell wall biosynthesis